MERRTFIEALGGSLMGIISLFKSTSNPVTSGPARRHKSQSISDDRPKFPDETEFQAELIDLMRRHGSRFEMKVSSLYFRNGIQCGTKTTLWVEELKTSIL